jgi:succinate dehydrogenase / fumarate reductase iron-sulfur subunit
MRVTLKVWRQADRKTRGAFQTHTLDSVSPDSSFLEMMDQLNERLEAAGQEPIAFDHDCREGICGACSMTINGIPHGPLRATTACQLHMRHFRDGETITVEPFRAQAFPVLRDLVVDRSSLDRIIAAGGYIGVNTGSAPEANLMPVAKDVADSAFDSAACIGCGACAAACPNASAMLFVGAKVSHLALLPQGQAEARTRVLEMVRQMDDEGFGNCSNHAECEAVCPKEIRMTSIARLNAEFRRAARSTLLPRWGKQR